jgi:HEPN domain-containing protein
MRDLVCFCSQQAAEKYLKAMLEELGQTVPRTHDLEDLLSRLLPTHPQLLRLRRGCKFLIQFAVDSRYPGFDTTKRQAKAAMAWSSRVRDAARLLLGFPRPRKKSP